jgi:hypothetical protein
MNNPYFWCVASGEVEVLRDPARAWSGEALAALHVFRVRGGEREGERAVADTWRSSFHSCMDALRMQCAGRATNGQAGPTADVNPPRHELRET